MMIQTTLTCNFNKVRKAQNYTMCKGRFQYDVINLVFFVSSSSYKFKVIDEFGLPQKQIFSIVFFTRFNERKEKFLFIVICCLKKDNSAESIVNYYQ